MRKKVKNDTRENLIFFFLYMIQTFLLIYDDVGRVTVRSASGIRGRLNSFGFLTLEQKKKKKCYLKLYNSLNLYSHHKFFF